MKKLHFLVSATLLAATAVPSMLTAQGVSCNAGFGSAPSATFGGSGIQNSAVAYNNCLTGVSLNLVAHERYDNPAVTNNGAGVYTAQAGQDANSVSPVVGYAKWNFAYDIQGANINQYTYRLFFDNNPQSGNALDGYLNIPGIFGAPYANSLNLGMGFLDIGLFGPAPSYQPFDMNAAGAYQFRLVAYSGNDEVASTSILVNTTSTVPEPSTYALMAAGLVVIGAASRRKKQLA